MRSTVIIRADGGKRIGMGHIMRCSAVARELRTLSCQVVFAVSDEESAQAVAVAGESAILVGGRPEALSERDGTVLRNLVEEFSAKAVLIDSYGVTNAFFSQIKGAARVVYVDDTYLFSEGFLKRPYRYDIDAVVNYGFGFSRPIYETAYRGSRTELYIGPAFAPIREEFVLASNPCNDVVQRVLVTSGSTNPGEALERMVAGVSGALPNATIDVVVGPLGVLDDEVSRMRQVVMRRNVKRMSSLMERADLAVAAAGSTLYELCCVGVPTIALPIVENQLANAVGFSGLKLGVSLSRLDWSANDIRGIVANAALSKQLRQRFSAESKTAVDGRGAQRIACALVR